MRAHAWVRTCGCVCVERKREKAVVSGSGSCCPCDFSHCEIKQCLTRLFRSKLTMGRSPTSVSPLGSELQGRRAPAQRGLSVPGGNSPDTPGGGWEPGGLVLAQLASVRETPGPSPRPCPLVSTGPGTGTQPGPCPQRRRPQSGRGHRPDARSATPRRDFLSLAPRLLLA